MSILRPRGTSDILPEESCRWQALEALLRSLSAQYGFGELRTPIFEETELFSRGVGASTDIVQKEMYTFNDHGGRSISLRPENTASACRAYLEEKLYGRVQPVKLYCIGPMFRYEKPQAGRFRQFHQYDAEIFGSASPVADAEIISLAWDIYLRLGIRGLELKLNSVGCPECRPAYREALRAYFRPHLGKLCSSCQDRFDRNPLRILDCKSDICGEISAGAPKIIDYLCPDCAEHFARLTELLEAAGIPHSVDPKLVRGLDYYTKTAFEIVVEGIGAQSALCGGGRYDGLIAEIGGESTPGVGFALGMERIFSALAAQGDEIEYEESLDAYIISAGGAATDIAAFRLAAELRRAEIITEIDYSGKSLKAQIKGANRLHAAYAVIIGETELADNQGAVKDMNSGEQVLLPLCEIKHYLLTR